jgi:hypothetical protein
MAPERWAYAVLGRGRWASKIASILEAGQRAVTSVADTRRAAEESDEAYVARLEAALRATGAQAAWLCVPPGPHVASMMRAAIMAGAHAIAEKPWLCSPDETEALADLAARNGVRLGVHFEYCLLDEVEDWRARYRDWTGLGFGGAFVINRPGSDHLPPLWSLGSHLFAIRRYAVPNSKILELTCAYNAPDERRVWVERPRAMREEVDFFCNRQPIIQRFIRKFEAAEGAEFTLGVEFAARVAEDLLTWRGPQTMESLPR